MGYTSSKDDEAILPDGFKPTKHDVIVGWARQNYHHEGNQTLRDIVRENVPRYLGAQSKHDKGAVIVEILERIQRDSPSGYGLVRQHQDTGRWHYIGTDKAKDKIGHALRKASRDYEKTNSKSQSGQSNSNKSNVASSTASASSTARGSASPPISGMVPRRRGSMMNLSSSGPVTLSSRTSRDRALFRVSSLPNMSTSQGRNNLHPPIPAQVTVPSSPVRSNSSNSLLDVDLERKGYSSSLYYASSRPNYGFNEVGSPSRYSPSRSHAPSTYDHHSYRYNYSGSSPPAPARPPPTSRYDPRHYQYHFYFHHQHQHHHHHYPHARSGSSGEEGKSKDGPREYLPPTERSLTSLSSSSRRGHDKRQAMASHQSYPDTHQSTANQKDDRHHHHHRNGDEAFGLGGSGDACTDFDPIPVTSNDRQYGKHNGRHRHHHRHDPVPSPASRSQELCGFGGATFHALEPDEAPASANPEDFEPVPYRASSS